MVPCRSILTSVVLFYLNVHLRQHPRFVQAFQLCLTVDRMVFVLLEVLLATLSLLNLLLTQSLLSVLKNLMQLNKLVIDLPELHTD